MCGMPFFAMLYQMFHATTAFAVIKFSAPAGRVWRHSANRIGPAKECFGAGGAAHSLDHLPPENVKESLSGFTKPV